jgi:AAA domain
LNEDFERLFRQECEALRAPKNVKVDFPGRGGQPRRRKILAPGHNLSDILSEGEQKVIALADFLAEAAIPKASTPIVFDDPVSSLDHRRLQHVVDRIVRLTEDHQVIVFTHDILFVVALLARFEDQTGACTYYDFSSSEGSIGVVSPGTHPRWDTVAKTRGRVNEIIAQAAPGERRSATSVN